MVYALLYLPLLILAYLDIAKNRALHAQYAKFVLPALYVLFVTVSGVRWKTGNDWNPYYIFFDDHVSLAEFLAVRYEPGFALLNYLVKSFTSSYSVLLFLTAALVMFVKWKTIFKYASFPFVALLANVSFYAFDLFTVRQGIAIAVCVFSVTYIIQRKLLPFLLCVMLATSCHSTAIVFVVAYWVFRWDLSTARVLALSLVFLTVSTFVNISTILVFVTNFLSTDLYWLATVYADSKLELNSGLSENGLHGLRFLKGAVTLLAYGAFIDKNADPVRRGFFSLYAFYFLVTTLMAGENHVFMRFSMYFSVFEIFLTSEIFVQQRSMMRMTIFLCLIAYLGMKLIYGFYDTWDLFFPFETIFQSSFKETY